MKALILGRVAAALLLAATSACFSDSLSGPKDPTKLDFAPELGVNLSSMTKTSSGLYYRDLLVGNGEEAEVGERVTVHYTGWLHDGTKFDSSRDRGQPFQFVLGVGMVIPGWDEGIQGMGVGGRRLLVIPSQLAYGAAGSPPVIPRNATLVFDVELLAVEPGV